MVTRLGAFIRGSHPPGPSIVLAVMWTYGVTALFAAVEPLGPWLFDPGTAVAAATVAVNLLLLRALDDIRDLDYDRRHNPRRPLAAGRVGIPDLVVLMLAGGLGLLLLNAALGTAAAALAIQLGYAAAILIIDQWLGWPSGDALLIAIAVSCPVQILLNVYLYHAYLDEAPASGTGALAILAVMLAAFHGEAARKLVRRPRTGERTYVTIFGVGRLAAIAMAFAAASALVVVLMAGPARGWPAVLPVVFVSVTAWRFHRRGLPRWPPRAPLFYLLGTFTAYLAIALISS